jgi:predicted CXXCH cytochrome family protein
MRALVSAVAVIVLIAAPVRAGGWHSGSSLVCTDCHSQHGGATPAPKLLTRATTIELCLSCHDGMSPAAPDVIAPVGYVAESAAGAFPNSGGIATSHAHHLNNPTAEVPPGGTVPMVLTCTTCHDPHGNDNYRNLRPDPTRTGLADVAVIANQKIAPDGSNPADVYVPANVVYKAGVSGWCRQCHTTAHYPHEKRIWSSKVASYTAWTTVTLPRVPVLSPNDDLIPSTDDRVICLSCHKAHGSANDAMVIYADGATRESTCSECHTP